jgi:hypothetical protein
MSGEQAACGGQALLVGAAGRSEGVSEHADRDVVMKRRPSPHLMLIQAEQVLALFVAFLDPPPDPGDRDHVRDRCSGRGVDQEVPDQGGGRRHHDGSRG